MTASWAGKCEEETGAVPWPGSARHGKLASMCRSALGVACLAWAVAGAPAPARAGDDPVGEAGAVAVRLAEEGFDNAERVAELFGSPFNDLGQAATLVFARTPVFNMSSENAIDPQHVPVLAGAQIAGAPRGLCRGGEPPYHRLSPTHSCAPFATASPHPAHTPPPTPPSPAADTPPPPRPPTHNPDPYTNRAPSPPTPTPDGANGPAGNQSATDGGINHNCSRSHDKKFCATHQLSQTTRNAGRTVTVSYTHLRAHETVLDPVCRLLLEKQTE